MPRTCSRRSTRPSDEATWTRSVATEIKLPRLGQGMESGTIVKWLKAEGDEIAKGEPLYELDTDKVTQEVEADAGGVLLKIAVREGEVPVGQTIAVIGEAGEEVEEPEEAKVDDERAAASGPPVAADAVAPVSVSRAAEPAPGEVHVEQLSSMRKTIARRLTEAWQAPVFQLGVTVDMERAQIVRAKLVELHTEGAKPTLSDLLTKVCASALLRHPAVNALYKGDAIELHPTANVGIAVAIPNGLVVPVIRSAERLSVAGIANARAELVERARTGKLQQGDLDGGTFTISNLGMYGIERFVAVLNPPQAAILAIGSVEDKVVAVDGQPVVRPRMELTLTCDHRAVDGATGAQFLTTVKQFLEEPGLAL